MAYTNRAMTAKNERFQTFLRQRGRATCSRCNRETTIETVFWFTKAIQPYVRITIQCRQCNKTVWEHFTARDPTTFLEVLDILEDET